MVYNLTEKILKDVFQIKAKIIKDKDYNCPYFIPIHGIN